MLNLQAFQTKKLLGKNETDTLAQKILAAPENVFCHRFKGMKTLGAASYLDIKNKQSAKYWQSSGHDLDYYLSLANRYNPILLNLFESLYSKLCKFFADEFNVICELHPATALPGFHIYENSEQFGEQKAHIPHFDGQYNDLVPIFYEEDEYPAEHIGNTLSFTMPISLPSMESGLKTWNLHLDQTKVADKQMLKEKILNLKPEFVQYQEGVIVYHSGLLLHQIKSWHATTNDKRRITLQGHGILKNDRLFLYW